MRPIKPDDLPLRYQKQVEEQLSGKVRPALPASDNKPSVGDEQVAEEKAPRLDRQARIHFHTVRKRLADPDGNFTKYVLDSLVGEGVFQDDRQEFLEEVSHSQEQGKEERIVVEVYVEGEDK